MLAAVWSAVLILAAFVAAPLMFAGTLFVGAVISLAAWQEARRTSRIEDARAQADITGEDLVFAGAKPAQMSDFASPVGNTALPEFRRRRWRRNHRSEWVAFAVALLTTATGLSAIAFFIWFVGFRD